MTAIIATAPATPATHEEWIEVMNNSVSEFMLTIIPSRVIEAAATGDYLARLCLATEVQYFLRLEALTDDELRVELAETEAEHRRQIELDDPSEYDVNDHEDYYQRVWHIEELLAWREVQRMYTQPQPLTHQPFAALLAR